MISFRIYNPWDEQNISELIRKVYDEFVAIEYTKDWNEIFYKYILPEEIRKRQLEDCKIHIACSDERIIGALEVRNMNHISLLFVEKEFHWKWIATMLFKKFLWEVPENISSIDVHASPFSIPIYEKFWFQSIGSMKEENGMKYLPMEYKK